MNKKGQFRKPWGGLDLISGIGFLIGLYLTTINYVTLGWILIGISILKQFSGR